MQEFLKFITWRLCTAQHVSGVLTSIIRSSTTAVAAFDFTFGEWLPILLAVVGPAGPYTANNTAITTLRR